MRWSDLKFVRMALDIACQFTFCFCKGYRNPHEDNATTNKSEELSFSEPM